MNLRPRVPAVLRHRDFRLYLSGVVLSQLGTQGTFVAMLYHMYVLTGSNVQVGLVGAAQGIAVVVLSPLGGHYADKLDRRLLLQSSQALSMVASLALAVVTLAGVVEASHVVLAALANSAASAFDRPVRKAIIPAMVPRDELVQAFALMNPSGQVARLVGPGLSGVLIALAGPGLMYLLDAVTFVGLIVIVAFLRIRPMPASQRPLGIWSSIRESLAFVRRRPLMLHLMGLDLAAMIFAAYRVVLPALAVDILRVGPTGYGVLAAAPPVGALVGGVIVFRLAAVSAPAGRIVIGATMAYGASALMLAQSRSFAIALIAATGLGLFDAIGTTLRHAAVLLETPDPLLGRVSALYGMSAQGGPALGDLGIGWFSGVVGVTVALTLGGLAAVLYAATAGLTSRTVRDYRTSGPVA